MSQKRVRFCIRIALLLIVVIIILQRLFTSSPVKPYNAFGNAVISIEDQDYNLAENASERRLFHMNLNKNRSTISRQIQRKNDEQIVLNAERFGPLEEDSVVIVIQVHRRLKYLKQLISSLFQARNISSSLLVFSHDFYDDEINDCVQAIDFCKVIQIFYPYSLQTHPQVFPGTDPNDCPPNADDEIAFTIKCNNALYPDVRGYFRVAEYTEMKHHWWWKANRVFDGLQVTRNHMGPVLFLEEDQYVAQDFLHMLNLMHMNSRKLCPQCNILCLGNIVKSFKFSKVHCSPWLRGRHNIGIAFNRTTWSNIRRCARPFCTYDDHNWNWSLKHASEYCLPHKLVVLSAVAARVVPLGPCEIKSTNADCKSRLEPKAVQRMMRFVAQGNTFSGNN